MATSPNIENYQMSLGSLYIKIDGVDGSLRHVGNAPSITYSPDIDLLEHNQSMSGIQSVDFTLARRLSATLAVTLEEVTPENMALFVLGTPSANTAGDQTIGGLTSTAMTGDLEFIGANSIGQMIDFRCRVSITPTGEFNLISDEINTIELEMKVLQDDGQYGEWTLREQATA